MAFWGKYKKAVQNWMADEEAYNQSLAKRDSGKNVTTVSDKRKNEPVKTDVHDRSAKDVKVIKDSENNTETRIHPYLGDDKKAIPKSTTIAQSSKKVDDKSYISEPLYDYDDWYYATYSSGNSAPKRVNINVCIFENQMSVEEIGKRIKNILSILPSDSYIIVTRDDMSSFFAKKVGDVTSGISKFEILSQDEQQQESTFADVIARIGNYIPKIQIPGMITKSQEIDERSDFYKKNNYQKSFKEDVEVVKKADDTINVSKANNVAETKTEKDAKVANTSKNDTKYIIDGVNSTLNDVKVIPVENVSQEKKFTETAKKIKPKPKRRFFPEIFKPSKPVFEINNLKFTIFGRYKADMTDDELLALSNEVKNLISKKIDISMVTDYDKNIVNFMAMGLSINVRRI